MSLTAGSHQYHHQHEDRSLVLKRSSGRDLDRVHHLFLWG